jgi:hypothetical protein
MPRHVVGGLHVPPAVLTALCPRAYHASKHVVRRHLSSDPALGHSPQMTCRAGGPAAAAWCPLQGPMLWEVRYYCGDVPGVNHVVC